jgi:hypothetical protein
MLLCFDKVVILYTLDKFCKTHKTIIYILVLSENLIESSKLFEESITLHMKYGEEASQLLNSNVF